MPLIVHVAANFIGCLFAAAYLIVTGAAGSPGIVVALIGLAGTFISSVATVIIALINRREIRAARARIETVETTAREGTQALTDLADK